MLVTLSVCGINNFNFPFRNSLEVIVANLVSFSLSNAFHSIEKILFLLKQEDSLIHEILNS